MLMFIDYKKSYAQSVLVGVTSNYIRHIFMFILIIYEKFKFQRVVFIFKDAIAPPVAENFFSVTGRYDVPDPILGCTCRPSRSEFSLVFSETRINTG